MEQARRQELIEQYRNGYQAIVDALEGITEEELDAREAPGEWSPREIIHHLADSEMASALRLRMFVVEERPSIIGYDQEEYARKLFYDRPIEASLGAFRYARETTAELLDRMTDEHWQRVGTHSESGTYGALDWLTIYADHGHEHADQIRRARATV
jgi:hypothetical protein